MKFPNWAQVYAKDPNNEAYDKNATAITDLFLSAISAEECISNIKDEPNLIHLSIAPISEDVQAFHHLTQIGGNIATPVPMIVALSGFDSNPLPIRLDSDLFLDSDDVVVPPWKNLTKISSAQDVISLSSRSGSNVTFRNIITIPPS